MSPLLAQSGHFYLHRKCPLSGVKRTCPFALHMSAFDPKRTSEWLPTTPFKTYAASPFEQYLNCLPSKRYDRPVLEAAMRQRKKGGKSLKSRSRKHPRLSNASDNPRLRPWASPNKTEVARLAHELERERERQVATAEILRVIRRSPSDVQPVFETIVRNAVALCGGLFANVFRFDGELLH